MSKAGDLVTYEGAIYCTPTAKQLKHSRGGRTALSLWGKAHYFRAFYKKGSCLWQRQRAIAQMAHYALIGELL